METGAGGTGAEVQDPVGTNPGTRAGQGRKRLGRSWGPGRGQAGARSPGPGRGLGKAGRGRGKAGRERSS